jgi:hypothetical protein
MQRCYEATLVEKSMKGIKSFNHGFGFLLKEDGKNYLKMLFTNEYVVIDIDSNPETVTLTYYKPKSMDDIMELSKFLVINIPKEDFEIPFKLNLPTYNKQSLTIEIVNTVKGEKEEIYKAYLEKYLSNANLEESD